MSLKVSLLLDGQLEREEARVVLDEVGRDEAQRDRYTLYGLVGDALRGNPTPDDGFTQRILERMRREGARMEEDFDPLAG
jgi:negative regulator of sigma E activity